MLNSLLLAAIGSAFVGALVGATSIGGFLMVPLLMLTLDLPVSQAVATTLVSYIPTGVIANYLYYRNGRMDVRLGIGLGLLTLPGIWAGLWLSEWMSDRAAEMTLSALLSILALYVGRQVLKDRQGDVVLQRSDASTSSTSTDPSPPPASWRTQRGRVILVAASMVAGAAASLAGVGGALILVPLMVSLGMLPPVAVGTGLLFSFVASLLASLGKIMSTPVPLTPLLLVIGASTVGILVGEAMARRIDASSMRIAIAALCLLSAVAVLI